jgi:hypothetical protein
VRWRRITFDGEVEAERIGFIRAQSVLGDGRALVDKVGEREVVMVPVTFNLAPNRTRCRRALLG